MRAPRIRGAADHGCSARPDARLPAHTIFLVNVPIGVAVILAALRYLPADERLGSRRIDLVGVGTLSAAILLIVLPLSPAGPRAQSARVRGQRVA